MSTNQTTRAQAVLDEAAKGCEWLIQQGPRLTADHALLCDMYHRTRRAFRQYTDCKISDDDLGEWLDGLKYQTGLLCGCSEDLTA